MTWRFRIVLTMELNMNIKVGTWVSLVEQSVNIGIEQPENSKRESNLDVFISMGMDYRHAIYH